MAVALEFINIIIPIANINRCRSIGGFEGYLQLESHSIGEIIWHDDYLVREGVMNPFDIEDMIDTWAERGLNPITEIGSDRTFKDLCVIDSLNGLTLPCSWIHVNLKEQVAWLKDKPKGQIIGRDSGEHGGIPFVASFE